MIPIVYDAGVAIAVKNQGHYYYIDCETGDDMWARDDYLDFKKYEGPFDIYNKTKRLYISKEGDIILTPAEIDIGLYSRCRCINLTSKRIEVFCVDELEILPKEFRITINENNN